MLSVRRCRFIKCFTLGPAPGLECGGCLFVLLASTRHADLFILFGPVSLSLLHTLKLRWPRACLESDLPVTGQIWPSTQNTTRFVC